MPSNLMEWYFYDLFLPKFASYQVQSMPDTTFPTDLESSMEVSRIKLLTRLGQLQTEDGHWEGKLSTSALSTATAISALSLTMRGSDGVSSRQSLVQAGLHWLSRAQNADGGFGDTLRSHSNIATTYLVIAAVRLAYRDDSMVELVQRATEYVERHRGWEGLRQRYGKDKTFVVPILTNCALAGMVDWKSVPILPFEAAALPQSWYRFARMPVVSYAIPALVAIGQVRHHFAPTRNPFSRWIRNRCRNRTLEVLERMQPTSGGYLEAVPLTSFVLMSLAAMGCKSLPVAKNCARFIEDSVLEDGSWPIDTNLATWVTSLAIRSIVSGSEVSANSQRADEEVGKETEDGVKSSPSLIRHSTIDWLLSCQHLVRHPFTGADPGGWGWTDLSGAVPDADDTPAALLALWEWRRVQAEVPDELDHKMARAIALGIDWLIGLQNRDGGWPTFCRGWGQLPFDRSGSDLTAHAIRALKNWADHPPAKIFEQLFQKNGVKEKIAAAIRRGVSYLLRQQKADGSWLPLWFGNQDDTSEENPIYGTSRVLMALKMDLKLSPKWTDDARQAVQRGVEFLHRRQNRDGGWGGGPSVDYSGFAGPPVNFRNEKIRGVGQSTVEETAVALEGLLESDTQNESNPFIMRGLRFLSDGVEQDWTETSWPIGFYFAKLWYHEKMYPIVFSLAALNAARKRKARETNDRS